MKHFNQVFIGNGPFPGRRNRSRFDDFWQSVNWQLPDSTLSQVWQVDRGNLHARRIRLGHPPPRWQVLRDQSNPVFGAAISLEKLKARKFAGAKPADTEITNPKGAVVKIASEVSLELVTRRDDGVALLDLHIRLLGVAGKHLSADINADDCLAHPQIISSSDTFGLESGECHAIALAAYKHMIRYFGDGPTGGTIKWARWVEADITPWLRTNLYSQVAKRVIRVLASYMPTDGSQSRSQSFSESLEV